MTMEKKMTTFAFGGGVRNVPSGRVCDDNDLSHEEGMLFVDGEHHVIRRPVENGDTLAYPLAFVHDYSTYTHYIMHQSVEGNDNDKLLWKDKDGNNGGEMGTFSGELRRIDAVGNTIVLSTTTGLLYYLWDGEDYKALGSLPELIVNSTLEKPQEDFTDDAKYEMRFVIPDHSVSPSETNSQYEAAKNYVVGHLAKMERIVKEKGYFPFPFWVRYGLRMYDESVTMLTAPQLMLACVRANNRIDGVVMTGLEFLGRYRIHYSRLFFSIKNNLSDYSDIVRGVVVYVSDDVKPFRLDGEWEFDVHNDGRLSCDGMYGYFSTTPPIGPQPFSYHVIYEDQIPDEYARKCPVWPEMLSDEEIKKALIARSQFYELCFIDINKITSYGENYFAPFAADEQMEYHALSTITARTQLAHEDYFDHCKLAAGVMYTYNGRLQLGNVTRSFFEGYDYVFPSIADTSRSGDLLEIYVKIKTDEGVKVVKREARDAQNYIGYWFYYPDPRAFEVVFNLNNQTIVSYPLQEHPYLNGAYMFRCLPISTDGSMHDGTSTAVPLVNNTPEKLPSYVVTSEVDNPYYFPVDGWNRIGSGVIRSLGAVTDALSEGQFGQFPLMAFTSEGVWAMSLTKEGLYDDIHPISREVITEEGIVVQTDDTLFFLSERGLAVVVGRKVKLVSEGLKGKTDDVSTFGLSASVASEFLNSRNGRGMVYDYPNSLLWIWKEDSDYALVYSIKSGAFAMSELPARWKSSHLLYPDVLVQDADGKILSFLGEGDVNDDTRLYDGVILSRPMKMKDILHEKRVLEMMHHMDLSGGDFSVSIWGSNDLNDWRAVPELGGMGWKYWRLKVEFSDMGATAVYSGTTMVYALERAHRLREEE